MIIGAFLQIIVDIVAIILSWLPNVTTLPTIAGYDIDTALVTGVGYFNAFSTAVWPLAMVWQGFLVLMSYYSIKMLLKFFLGHRAPGRH